jgi:hypothetical protein
MFGRWVKMRNWKRHVRQLPKLSFEQAMFFLLKAVVTVLKDCEYIFLKVVIAEKFHTPNHVADPWP